jgi:hypothetical protein
MNWEQWSKSDVTVSALVNFVLNITRSLHLLCMTILDWASFIPVFSYPWMVKCRLCNWLLVPFLLFPLVGNACPTLLVFSMVYLSNFINVNVLIKTSLWDRQFRCLWNMLFSVSSKAKSRTMEEVLVLGMYNSCQSARIGGSIDLTWNLQSHYCGSQAELEVKKELRMPPRLENKFRFVRLTQSIFGLIWIVF